MVGKAPDQTVQLQPGADVDSAGGFLEDQHAWSHCQAAADEHLLLVTTGKVTDLLPQRPGTDPHRVPHAARQVAFGDPLDYPEAADRRQAEHRQGPLNGLAEDQALGLAVRGDVGDAGANFFRGEGILLGERPPRLRGLSTGILLGFNAGEALLSSAGVDGEVGPSCAELVAPIRSSKPLVGMNGMNGFALALLADERSNQGASVRGRSLTGTAGETGSKVPLVRWLILPLRRLG